MEDPWHVLAERAGAAASAKISTTVVNLLMVHVLELRDPQRELLTSIASNVSALAEGPFYAGIRHLEDGLADGRTPAQRRRCVEKARDRFVDANAALRRDAAWRSLTVLHIGICSLALGDVPAARRELREAHEAAVERLEGISPWNETPKFFNNPLGAALIAGPTLGVANHLATRHYTAKARTRLFDLGRYVLGLRAMRAALGEKAGALPEHVVVEWQDVVSHDPVVVARPLEDGKVRYRNLETPTGPRRMWRLDGSPYEP
jgi:hypothetical protein